MSVIIRNYQKSDYPATVRLFKELSEDYNFNFQEEKWKEESGLRLFSPGYKRMTLIAEIDGEVVGMGFIEVRAEPTGELMGYLSSWGVAKEYHRRGIGEKLLGKAVTILSGLNVDAIRLNFSYDVSRNLLERVSWAGFKPNSILCEKTLTGSASEILSSEQEFGESEMVGTKSTQR
ncbi:MAG TPA: GNAT family N-acetyltransferase, partial [Candidatus Lokiarchaeia archaeon]|nr:GNAT family N-acetyltransferase [Candidatus Lokiarchaeia archaeon]